MKVLIEFRWGDTTVGTYSLVSPCTFSIGEGGDVPIPQPLLVLVTTDAVGDVFVSGRKLEEDPIKIDLGAYSLEVTQVKESADSKLVFEPMAWAGQGLSAAIHGALLLAFLLWAPALLGTDDESIGAEDLYWMQAKLQAEADPELEEKPSISKEDGSRGGEGATTRTDTSPTPGSSKTPSLSGTSKGRGAPAMSRSEMLRDATEFGMIALLGTLPGSKEGDPWGTGVGLTGDGGPGYGGWGSELELSGTGLPGGDPGRWQGKYLDSLEICPGGICTGTSTGVLPLSYRPKDLKPPRQKDIVMTGRIPSEIIQRVVRQSFGRFRGCYESALRTNPSLSGRVSVAFVVARDGSVSSAQSAGSDLPDAGVVACVVKGFYGLSFPAPEDGIVRVTYPIVFSPK